VNTDTNTTAFTHVTAVAELNQITAKHVGSKLAEHMHNVPERKKTGDFNRCHWSPQTLL
jgi:hypothetical protein